MIKIPVSLMREMFDHAESSYPNECCGLLVGTTGETKVVRAIRNCNNLNTERARDRYDLDPQDMLRVEREFENSPWDIIGIYHSHPDHPSRASQFDTERAWAGYSYVIISVNNRKIGSVQSWVLEDDRKFGEESLMIEGGEERQ